MEPTAGTNNSFKKSNRLLNKHDFQSLRDGSRLFVSDVLLFYVKNNEFEDRRTRIGLAVSKKYGKAPRRNRLKRVLREKFRNSEFMFTGEDILISLNYRKINQKKFDAITIELRVGDALNHAFNNEFKR